MNKKVVPSSNGQILSSISQYDNSISVFDPQSYVVNTYQAVWIMEFQPD